MNKISLSRNEFKKIKDILNKFPDVELFKIVEKESAGIGSIVNLEIETKIDDISGKFIVEISGVENW